MIQQLFIPAVMGVALHEACVHQSQLPHRGQASADSSRVTSRAPAWIAASWYLYRNADNSPFTLTEDN